METVKVSSLKGGEILAKDIILENGVILIPKKTVLKIDYIESMMELGIERIYIEANSDILISKNFILDITIKEKVKEIVKDTLEEHMYKKFLGLDRLIFVANEIVKAVEDNMMLEKTKYDVVEHNSDLFEHIIQVCSISIAVAIKMNLSKRDIYDVALGSLLHDIGLRYITVNYKNCNIDELTPNEIFEYKKHTIYGYLAIEEMYEVKSEIKNLVLFHHEKMDGSGYPLKYSNLSVCQRILSVCNDFESYISGMGCIRKTKEETMTLLENMSGVQYDGDAIKWIKEFFYK